MTVGQMFRLDGKVALISGAGRGIGAATALALAEAGADVAVLARNVDQLASVAAGAREFGRRALAVPTDAFNAEAVQAAVDQTMAEFGRLDIVVNVVGGSMPQAFLGTTDRDLHNAFESNVVSGLRLARMCTPHLLASGGGSIVFISSAIGHVVGRGFVAYGAGKSAVDQTTRLLAAELNPRIRVNAVAPGAILTEALEFVASNPEIKQMLESGTHLQRLGEPEDIAAAVLFLASPASSYITGQILNVDGGLLKANLDMPFPDL
jgi:7-alpha-hydroxysteroid dehydrogenase